jgi:hypothetical protein
VLGGAGVGKTRLLLEAAGIGLEDPPAVARAKLAALLDRGAPDGSLVAERTFLDLVEQLTEGTSGAPVLLVAVARPELLEQRPAWAGGRPNAVSVLLEPLGADDSGALALTEALAATFDPGYH